MVSHGFNLVSVDIKSQFNKTSQSPVHFSYPISNRKLERLLLALAALRTHDTRDGSFMGRLPGFDEFDGNVRSEYYGNI